MKSVSKEADVLGVHFTQVSSPSIQQEIEKDLELRRKLAEVKSLEEMRKDLDGQINHLMAKRDWIDGILGKGKTIKTTRAPHGTAKIVLEGLERYFKANRGKLLSGDQLREACKVALNGFKPSEAMYTTSLAQLRKRFNIVATGAPQLRTYKLE